MRAYHVSWESCRVGKPVFNFGMTDDSLVQTGAALTNPEFAETQIRMSIRLVHLVACTVALGLS